MGPNHIDGWPVRGTRNGSRRDVDLTEELVVMIVR